MTAQPQAATSAALRVSIVVPSFRQAPYLARTLDSILLQDHPPHEVIVADGGSQDGTVEILRDYAARFPQLRWRSEPDSGPADAVNKGLAQVTGDIVGIQSSDDIYYPGAFRAVVEEFRRHPECGFIYGDLHSIDEHDVVQYTRRMPEFSWKAVFAVSMCLPQSSIFFRSALLHQTSGWDSSFYGCDLEYWLRLIFRTPARKLSRVLSGWRRYEAQRTRPEVFQRIWRDYWRMIDQSPDIAAAPAEVRRYARASRHLLVLRFPPSESHMLRWKHLLIGAALHPGFWRHNPPAMLAAMLPGFKVLRAIKRMLIKPAHVSI